MSRRPYSIDAERDGLPHDLIDTKSPVLIWIAIILAIITAVEVALYYIPNMPSGLLFWILMALSTVKFYTVAAFFMHLKFDHTSFTGYFVGGMALAMATFLGLLALQYATHGAPSGF